MKTASFPFVARIATISLILATSCWLTTGTLRGAAPGGQECQFVVSPTRVDLQAAAQSGVVQVDTQPGCTWSVSVDADWIRITDAGSGTGPGSIAYAVSALAVSEIPIRQGRILVRWNTPTLGQNVQITQSAGTCNANFSPSPGPTSAETFGASGGGGDVWVLSEPASSGPWFVAEKSEWITMTSPPLTVLGHGDGQAYFAVSPNPSPAPRDGTIRFCNGQSMTVHQSGRSIHLGPFVPSDFDGDGIADLAVFRPSTGTWYVLPSRRGYHSADALTYQWGRSGDVPVPGDFDGDALTDLAVYRPQGGFGSAPSGNWNIRYSSANFDPAKDTSYAWPSFRYSPQDVPLLADFSGDGKQDFVVYSPPRGEWHILFTNATVPGGGGPLTSVQWGLPGDVPVPADFDGDGKADLAVWRPSNGTWYIRQSSTGYSYQSAATYQWGLPGDLPQTGDFDGDGKTDLAVWRPSEGRWYVLYSSTRYTTWSTRQWGLPGDVPTLNDFDGDGLSDFAVWRPSNGTWYLLFSTTHYRYDAARAYQWGLPGDVPITIRPLRSLE